MSEPGTVDDGTHVVIGAGPLGRAVATRPREADASVRLVNRRRPDAVPDSVDVRVADTTDADETVAACAGAAAVYDCVWLPYPEWSRTFPAVTDGIVRVATAADARIVVADNCYAYGPVDGPITERHQAGATDAKGRTRAARARTYLDAPVPATIGRASDFFGLGVIDTAPVVDPFGAALRGERVAALGDPSVPHTFCFVPDFAAALVTLGAHDRAFGEAWHVPHPETVTIDDFLERVFDAAGTECAVRSAPWFVEALLGVVNADVRELRAIRYQFSRPFVVDDSTFADAFDLAATPLDEAIESTLSWHRTERDDGHVDESGP
jgi:nucleoside-diphosphate-sugar epimerase